MSVRIEQSAIRGYFVRQADEDLQGPVLDAALLQQFLAQADPTNGKIRSGQPDTREEIAARLAALTA